MTFGIVSKSSLFTGIFAVISGCATSPEGANSSLSESSGASLVGTWAKMAMFTSNSSALGINSKSRVARYVLIKTEKVGGKMVASEQTCDIKSASTGGSSLSFSQKLIDSVAPNTYSFDLQSNGAFTMPNAVELLGLKLTNKATDPLPTSGAEVVDQDNDGNPGVSVDVSARVVFTIKAQVYVVQRTIWSESGTYDGQGKITGLIDWNIEQKTLGASNSLFTAVSPSITTLKQESPFTMIKIADGSTCADVIKLQGQGLPNL